MKTILMFVMALLVASPAWSAAGGFEKEKFTKVIYLAYGGSTANSGLNPAAPKSFADQDLWAIPANTIIEKVYMVIDTEITGTTDIDIGDDDDPDGFLDGSLSLTALTAGMYGWNVKLAGAYLRTQTAGATDALDIYVVPNAKYYSATGKEVKIDATTTNTAGKARVIIEGYYLGARNQ